MREPLHLCSECGSSAKPLNIFYFDSAITMFSVRCCDCGKQTEKHDTKEMAEHIWNVINREEGNKR